MDASKQKWASLKANKQLYEEKMQKDNEMLYFNYPSLFQMHVEDRLDTTFFEMLALKRKIEKGEITPEQATTVIGRKLHERYLPQNLQQAPPTEAAMSYSQFYQSTP